MPNQLLLYIAAAIPFLWGTAHLFPTSSVVKGFGDISADNKNIITMEWIIEGVALIFIGFIIGGVTYTGEMNNTTNFVYITSAGVLIVLAVVSIFTGFRVNFLPFKLCPILFTLSTLLIIIGY